MGPFQPKRRPAPGSANRPAAVSRLVAPLQLCNEQRQLGTDRAAPARIGLTVARMHRLFLTCAANALAFFALVSPAWAAWVWPLNGPVITPYSNADNPYAGGQHRGLDIAGETGAPVVAAAGGRVRFAGTAGSSGLTVSIRTTDGFDTSYLHLSSASVREGESVAAGERIGAVGTSGTRSAEQAHLHFGVREAGSRHAYHDPLALLPAPPPAAESPREAPVGDGAPAPVAPVPSPSPEPLAVSSGEGAPAPREAPIRRRLPAGRPAPAVQPSRGRRRVAADIPARSPLTRATAVASPEPARPAHDGERSHATNTPERPADRAPRPIGRTGPGTAPQRSVAADSTPSAAATPAHRGPSAAPARGPDIGLVLACLGLLGAAALLGLSEDGRAATRRGGRRPAGLVRPLVSRR